MSGTKKKVKTFRRDFIFIALALIGVGAMFIFMPNSSIKLICYITASLLCVWGIIKLFMYFSQDRKEIFGSYGLVMAIALIIGGVSIFINPEFFQGIIAVFFGCVLIIDGVMKIQYGIDLARIGAKFWGVVLAVAVIMIAMGFLVVFNPFFGAVAFMIFSGIALVINGVSDLLTALYISRVLKKLAEKERAITLSEEDYKDEA